MANSYVFYANKNGRPTGLPGFVGPKGPQGEQGEQGIQGPQGEPGIFIGAEEDMPAGTRVRLDPNGSPDIAAVINDTEVSTEETWSSNKINTIINNLPKPMVLKGTLGTAGTITDLPTAAESNHGDTYKVITAGTYAGIQSDVGDVFSSTGTAWVLIPSGDEAVWTYGTVDIGVGAPLATGSFYAVYEE